MRVGLWGCVLVPAGIGGLVRQAGAPGAACAGRLPSAGAAAARAGRSYRFDRNGWTFVHLEGAPAEIGFQHGHRLAPEIDDLLRVMKLPPRDLQARLGLLPQRGGDGAVAGHRRRVPGRDRRIVDGLAARGVAADRWDLVALNAFEEVLDYYVPRLDAQQGRPPVAGRGNCSAFVATGDWTRRPHRHGPQRVDDLRDGGAVDDRLRHRAERGHRILMDALPGLIASDDDFGVNGAGIMITETTITGFKGFDPAGTPEFFRARKAMQYAESIDDVVRIMRERNNGGYANDWLIGDAKTGEIALFELGLKNSTVDRTNNGYFVGANFPVKEKLTREETDFDPANAASSPNARRARWEQLMAEHKGRIDIEAAKAFEADRYDVIERRDGPSERSLCGAVEESPRGVPEWHWPPYWPGGTVQAKVMDSAMARRLELWAAAGRPCAGDFLAEPFLERRPQFAWMRGLLRDMTSGPWTRFAAGMSEAAR